MQRKSLPGNPIWVKKVNMGLNDNESQSNVDLYNRWWREGWKLAYNERKCRKKYHQTGKLIKKSKRYAKELKTVIIPGTSMISIVKGKMEIFPSTQKPSGGCFSWNACICPF